MNEQETNRILAVLKAGYPTRLTILAETPVFWQMILADVPYPAVMEAVIEHGRHGKPFPPEPSELRRIVTERLVGLPEPSDAWRMVLERMRTTYPGIEAGSWDAPDAIRRTVEALGGMYRLRTSARPGDDEKRFAATYTAYRERALREASIPELCSALEASSAATCPAIDDPTRKPVPLRQSRGRTA